jgi:hypothetical protein
MSEEWRGHFEDDINYSTQAKRYPQFDQIKYFAFSSSIEFRLVTLVRDHHTSTSFYRSPVCHTFSLLRTSRFSYQCLQLEGTEVNA